MIKNKPTPYKGYPVKKPFKTMAEVDAYFSTDKLTCLLCGREYISLHVHTYNFHGVGAEEYKSMFGIPWTRGLIAESLRLKQSYIMNMQRKMGILPSSPSAEHIKKLIEYGPKNRRPVQAAVRNAMSKHALKTHNRVDKWSAKDFDEYLNRIKTGRTITEVGRDKDMPCREVFDEYRRDNPDFAEKFEKTWDKLPFLVQVRGQRTGESFKKRVVELRLKELSWPDIGRVMGVKESTVRNCWHRLKIKELLGSYIEANNELVGHG